MGADGRGQPPPFPGRLPTPSSGRCSSPSAVPGRHCPQSSPTPHPRGDALPRLPPSQNSLPPGGVSRQGVPLRSLWGALPPARCPHIPPPASSRLLGISPGGCTVQRSDFCPTPILHAICLLQVAHPDSFASQSCFPTALLATFIISLPLS